jgi:UDP-glucose 4-epimerase
MYKHLKGAHVNALVTGGAGFIGSHLVDRLLVEGHCVTVVDNFVTGKRSNLQPAVFQNPKFQLVEMDIRDSGIKDLLSDLKCDVVFHLAAQMNVRNSVQNPLYDSSVNVLGTINVAQACSLTGVKRLIFASSGGCIYGPPDAIPVDENFPTRPHSPYGASKLAAEIYIGTYSELFGLSATTLALGNVYGPRQDPKGEAGVIAIFSTAAMEGRQRTIFGDGSSSRDYIHIDDVIDAFLLAVLKGERPRYNIGSGMATQIKELHSLVAIAVGVDDKPVYRPARLGELQAITLDCSRATADLGWHPKWSLSEGVYQTVHWLSHQRERDCQ